MTATQFSDGNSQGEYPVFDANSEIAWIDEYDQNEKYISIIKDGAGIGRTELRQAKSSIIGTMGYIKPTTVHVTFLYALMKTFDWTKYQNGSTIPHLYYRDYGAEVLAIPSLQEQQKIGAIFEYLDHLITLHQRKLLQLFLV